MNPRQIELVRDNFVHVLFASDQAATLFYERLFELAPETRSLFKQDLSEQGARLIRALAQIVTSLCRFDAMLPELRDLAVRHVAYGVQERHYHVVGEALLHMLTIIARPTLDAETKIAWQEAYAQIAGVMIEASHANLTSIPSSACKNRDRSTLVNAAGPPI